MARATDGNEQLLCSFCGKSQRQVKKLIAGPGVYICDECIDLCNEIIDEELTAPAHLDLDSLPRPKEIYAEPQRLRRLPGRGEADALGRRLQPLQARPDGAADGGRGRAAEVEHPAARPDRLRQDPPRADPRAHPQRPLRHRRRNGADGGWLRRRGRREHPAQADPGRRLRHQEGRDGDHLHRRGGQDRPQGGQPLDHARRLRRGRAAGAPEDPRGDGRVGAAAGRPQAPAPGVPLHRHDERALHLRWLVRRAREDHRAACGAERRWLRREDPLQALPGIGGGAVGRDAGGPARLRPDPRVHRPAAGRLARPPAEARRSRPDPHRAQERAGQAVPALLQLRLDRARVHRGRAVGDLRPCAGARDRRARLALHHRRRAARRDVRAALAQGRLQVRDHEGDDLQGLEADARHLRRRGIRRAPRSASP